MDAVSAEALTEDYLDALEDLPARSVIAALRKWNRSQSSPEEVAAIRSKIEFLIGKKFRDRDGNERLLELADVVAPYNLQVNALRAALPPEARVGTVDKFQGQEAPVCLVSMTSSSADEIPRGVDFLFSLNRINVAISRAQILSIVVASRDLLEVPCTNIEQVRQVNSLCALKKYGDAIAGGKTQ
jgi:superfamily I DNA and/or RNA helicase